MASVVEEPEWCRDRDRRVRLTIELAAYLEAIESLVRVASANVGSMERGERCQREPSLKVPPLVRDLAAEWKHLKDAIAAVTGVQEAVTAAEAKP